MSFGKSQAKLMGKETPKVTFADVAGVDEAKEELQEIIDFLKMLLIKGHELIEERCQ